MNGTIGLVPNYVTRLHNVVSLCYVNSYVHTVHGSKAFHYRLFQANIVYVEGGGGIEDKCSQPPGDARGKIEWIRQCSFS